MKSKQLKIDIETIYKQLRMKKYQGWDPYDYDNISQEALDRIIDNLFFLAHGYKYVSCRNTFLGSVLFIIPLLRKVLNFLIALIIGSIYYFFAIILIALLSLIELVRNRRLYSNSRDFSKFDYYFNMITYRSIQHVLSATIDKREVFVAKDSVEYYRYLWMAINRMDDEITCDSFLSMKKDVPIGCIEYLNDPVEFSIKPEHSYDKLCYIALLTSNLVHERRDRRANFAVFAALTAVAYSLMIKSSMLCIDLLEFTIIEKANRLNECAEHATGLWVNITDIIVSVIILVSSYYITYSMVRMYEDVVDNDNLVKGKLLSHSIDLVIALFTANILNILTIYKVHIISVVLIVGVYIFIVFCRISIFRMNEYAKIRFSQKNANN